MIKVCEFCKEEFNASKSIRKFCSIKCSIVGKRTCLGLRWKVKNKQVYSKERNKKISDAKMGVKRSAQTCVKMSETKKRLYKEGLASGLTKITPDRKSIRRYNSFEWE